VSRDTSRPIHLLDAVVLPGCVQIVRATAERDGLDRVPLGSPPGIQVAELEKVAGVAAAASGGAIAAAIQVAFGHGALDGGGDVTRGLLQRPRSRRGVGVSANLAFRTSALSSPRARAKIAPRSPSGIW
jgi:hypothetical protein